MDYVGIETTQNVFIEHNIASVGLRMIAKLIDYVALSVYLFIVLYIAGLSELNNFAWISVLVLPALFYTLVAETVNNGQTFGKKIMKIRVVKTDGRQATLGNFIIRWLLGIIDVLLLYGTIGLVTIIVNGKGQRLGDIAAGTTVIKLKHKATLSNTIFIPLKKDYKPTFLETRNLADSDVQTINDVIAHYYQNFGSPIAEQMVEKAKKEIEIKLGVKSKLTPTSFLQTVIRDYNYVHKG